MNLESIQHRPIECWVEKINAASLPVLARTLQQIKTLRAKEDHVRPRDVSQLVLHDPLMALRVLRYLRTDSGARTLTDITTVEHAVMMLGVSPFFRTFSSLKAVESDLAGNGVALGGVMEVVSRSRHAAMHAREWAQLRRDIESEEVVIAALLHDMAEMLLWYFAPTQAEDIRQRLAGDPRLRSHEIQRAVLGFSLNDLQLALASVWDLPPLLTSLMDDFRADRPRARNVLLAVNLARHAANGWEDAALPEDIAGVGRLIGRPAQEVAQRIFDTAIAAVRDQEWYGGSVAAAWLPPFPLDVDHGTADGARQSAIVLAKVKSLLEADAPQEVLDWVRIGGTPTTSTALSLPALVALVMHGLYKGVGLARQIYYEINSSGTLARPCYLGGCRETSRIARVDLPLGMANPLTAKLTEQGALWWQADSDPLALTDLPREWRIAAGSKGFFAGLLQTADGRGALLYADSNVSGPALTEERFGHFRDICEKLSGRLAVPPMPRDAETSA